MTNCRGRLDEVRAASRSNWKSDSVIVSAGVRSEGASDRPELDPSVSDRLLHRPY